MKRMPAFCALCFVLAAGGNTYADIARPSPSPEQPKIIFHTSMTVIPDKKAREARLQISQDSLNELKAALANTSADNSMRQRIANSPTRTVIAGLCLFLSLSIGGIWLMRSAQPRGQKAVALLLLGVAVVGGAAIITQANAGPPPSYQWRNLSQNLNANKPTYASVDIEILPEGYGMKLVVPVKNQ
jgi:hypothetical protein